MLKVLRTVFIEKTQHFWLSVERNSGSNGSNAKEVLDEVWGDEGEREVGGKVASNNSEINCLLWCIAGLQLTVF